MKPPAEFLREPGSRALPFFGGLAFLVVLGQAIIVVEARPQDLITGVRGMADILSRAWPPDFSKLPDILWPALETVDIGVFGTVFGVILAHLSLLGADVGRTPAAHCLNGRPLRSHPRDGRAGLSVDRLLGNSKINADLAHIHPHQLGEFTLDALDKSRLGNRSRNFVGVVFGNPYRALPRGLRF